MTDKADKALNIISYTKGVKNSYAGPRFESGYHSFVLDGKSYQGTRDNQNRINQVKGFDFADKVVLDIGCNMGGMLHALGSRIKYGVGVDFSSKCINAANIVKDLNGQSNLNFYVLNLDKEDLGLINNFVLEDKVDICMFLAVAMHIQKWKDVIQFCHETSDTLLFESNGKPHQQKAQLDFLENLYNTVTFLFKDSRRQMYLCTK